MSLILTKYHGWVRYGWRKWLIVCACDTEAECWGRLAHEPDEDHAGYPTSKLVLPVGERPRLKRNKKQ